MLLSEFKEYLAYGELAHLAIGDLASNENQVNRIISAINLGVTELYKRFPIKLGSEVITLEDSTYEYALPADLVKIEAIYDSEDIEIPLNDHNNTLSVFTTNYNVLKHPYPVADLTITVEYRVAAPKLALDSEDTEEIEIPPQFTEALVNYVAYRMFAAINMNSAEAVNYYAKFEAACALINNLGLWDKSADTNLRLGNAGWL
jgi:hypothetical protein